jgi:hypothetical protein
MTGNVTSRRFTALGWTSKVTIGIVTSIAVVFGGVVSVSTASPLETGQDALAPVAFTVNVPPEYGVSASTTEVVVHAWPSQEVDEKLVEGDEFNFHEVDAALSFESGKIAVHVDKGSIPTDYIGASGLVDFEVQVINRASGWAESTAVTARAVSLATGESWIDAMYASEDLATLEPGTPIAATVDLVDVAEQADECADTETPVEDCEPEISSPDGPGPLAAPCRFWVNETGALVENKNVWVRTGATFALKTDDANSRAQMIYSSSREHHTTAGIGVSFDAVNYSQSGTRTMSGQWGKTFAMNKSYTSYRIEAKYGRYRVNYIEYEPGCGGFPQNKVGNKWRPRYETGGATAVSISRPSVYTRCANQTAGPWERTSSSASAYAHSGGVLIKGTIGLNLKSESQYATFKKYVYDINGSDKKICGNNDYPAQSRLQMLRYR